MFIVVILELTNGNFFFSFINYNTLLRYYRLGVHFNFILKFLNFEPYEYNENWLGNRQVNYTTI